MGIVENACELAYKWHDGQMYGDKPYVLHLSDVVQSLYTKHLDYRDPVLIATGWLHDIIEDTLISPEEIAEQCGMEVYEAVVALTKWSDVETYEEYIQKVKRNPIALEVKIADTLANLTASVMNGEKGRVMKYSRQMQLLVGE